MKFEALESQLDELIHRMIHENLIKSDKFPSAELMNFINEQSCLITIHDVEYYRPVCINDAIKKFYGFSQNVLSGLDHLYYMKTIHVSTYHTLLESIYFFRENSLGFLNLQYKLLQYDKQWVNMLGTTKSIFFTKKGKPKYAMTLLQKSREIQLDSLHQRISLLSKREKEIVGMINAGLARKEIAARLFLSTDTVKTHVKKIYRKLNINSVSQLNSICDAFNIQEELEIE